MPLIKSVTYEIMEKTSVFSVVRVLIKNKNDLKKLTGHMKTQTFEDNDVSVKVKMVRTNQMYDKKSFQSASVGSKNGFPVPWILLRKGSDGKAKVATHEGIELLKGPGPSIDVDLLYRPSELREVSNIFENKVAFGNETDATTTFSLVSQAEPKGSLRTDHLISDTPPSVNIVVDLLPDMSGTYIDMMHQPLKGGVSRTLFADAETKNKYVMKEPYSSDEAEYTSIDPMFTWSASLTFDDNGVAANKGVSFQKEGHVEGNDDYVVRARFGPNLKYLEWDDKAQPSRVVNVWTDINLMSSNPRDPFKLSLATDRIFFC